MTPYTSAAVPRMNGCWVCGHVSSHALEFEVCKLCEHERVVGECRCSPWQVLQIWFNDLWVFRVIGARDTFYANEIDVELLEEVPEIDRQHYGSILAMVDGFKA